VEPSARADHRVHGGSDAPQRAVGQAAISLFRRRIVRHDDEQVVVAVRPAVAPGDRAEQVNALRPVRRDLAVTVDETTPVQAILDGLLRAKPAIVHEVWVFDVYRGKGIENGEKGLAFRVLLQDTQKTLTDAEVDAAIAGLRKVLEQEYGAKLRK